MRHVRWLLVATVLLSTGCVCVTVEHAANVEQLDENVKLLMPYAQKQLQAEAEAQKSKAADAAATAEIRSAAQTEAKRLTGLTMTAKLTPQLSRLIADWSTSKVDAEKLKAEQARRNTEAAVPAGGGK